MVVNGQLSLFLEDLLGLIWCHVQELFMESSRFIFDLHTKYLACSVVLETGLDNSVLLPILAGIGDSVLVDDSDQLRVQQ